MKELIERLKKAKDEVHGYTYSMPFNLSEQDIETILSALQGSKKSKEEVWEEAASYHHVEGMGGNGRLREAIYMAMEEYANQDGWVSVETRLPLDNGNYYLVVVKNKNKEDGVPIFDVAQYECGMWCKPGTWEAVTHWMPLPQPPTQKG